MPHWILWPLVMYRSHTTRSKHTGHLNERMIRQNISSFVQLLRPFYKIFQVLLYWNLASVMCIIHSANRSTFNIERYDLQL